MLFSDSYMCSSSSWVESLRRMRAAGEYPTRPLHLQFRHTIINMYIFLKSKCSTEESEVTSTELLSNSELQHSPQVENN